MNSEYSPRERILFAGWSACFAAIVLICAVNQLRADDVEEKPLYQTDFEQAEIGKLPEGIMSLNGDFVVKRDRTNKFLELPGAPLDAFAVQFGPTERSEVMISAQVFGTAKGRRYPTFGVGLGGVGGYHLQVSPGKMALEIFEDLDLKTSVDYEWQPGVWTAMRMRIRKIGDAEWEVQGKAWPVGKPEPTKWQITWLADKEPRAGRASVSGSPFSGTPIRFDDLVVERTNAK